MLKDLLVNIGASIIYDFGKAIKNKAAKNETVQTVLKHLNVSPNLHNFPDRYVEALVEFRFLEKDAAIMAFFREESITQAFFNFYYGDNNVRNNEATLRQTIDHCVEALKVGDDVKAKNIDVTAEIEQFWNVFKQKVQESRTVKEVEVGQILENLTSQTDNIHKVLANFQDMLINKGKEYVQYADKVYNIDEINEANFGTIIKDVKNTLLNSQAQAGRDLHIGDVIQHFYGSNPKNDENDENDENEYKGLNVWIISTTKDYYTALNSAKLKKGIPHELYHESDATEWKPFKDGDSIKQLMEEYKSKVNFEVEARFLGNEPLEEAEKSWVFKNLKKFVLVFDPLALHEENLKTISHFNTHDIGGCLGLICHCVPYDLFSYIHNQVTNTLDRLQTCFLDYSEKYIHFIFPISTKDMLFRSLTNIAMVHIKVSTKIENANKLSEQHIRKESFKFSI